MLTKTRFLYALLSLVLLVGAGASCYYAYAQTLERRGCTGSKSCRVCKNCRYCRHCSLPGNSCGVCRR